MALTAHEPEVRQLSARAAAPRPVPIPTSSPYVRQSDSSQRQFRKLMCRAPGTDIATGQPVGDYVKSMQLPLEETGCARLECDALRRC